LTPRQADGTSNGKPMTLVVPNWAPRAGAFPEAPLFALDTVWFQIAGTLCNLECSHCFISSSPSNHSFETMSLAEVLPYLEEARALGVRDYYFTGGEPLLVKDLHAILEATLAQGAATVLTNGVSIKDREAARFAELAAKSRYSLDLRISLDGYDAETNDAIRGEGTYARILAGIRALADQGMSPIITVTEACEAAATRAGRTRFLEALRGFGLTRPRLKIMPLLRMGAEARRLRSYDATETLAGQVLDELALDRLVCARSRMVTQKGVWVCPILLDEPTARLGSTLRESMVPFRLSHGGCFTCHAEGLSCAT
jgi:AdoMet-dependent heme synthase